MKNYLHSFEIFNDLSNEEIELFTNNIKIDNYKKDEIIINEGEEGNSLLFVIDGKIVITQALTLATNKLDEGDDREKQLTNLDTALNKYIDLGAVSKGLAKREEQERDVLLEAQQEIKPGKSPNAKRVLFLVFIGGMYVKVHARKPRCRSHSTASQY